MISGLKFATAMVSLEPLNLTHGGTFGIYTKLGAGFNIFLFSPQKLGKISNLTSAYFSDFQMGGSTTNQKKTPLQHPQT